MFQTSQGPDPRRAALVFALLSGLALSWPSVAGAQSITDPLSAGFGNRRMELSHEADVNAHLFTGVDGTRCGGFVGPSPEFRLQVSEPVEFSLRLLYGYVGSLVVHGPDGVRCTGEPTAGATLSDTWPAGTYSVYIGAPSRYYGGWVEVEAAEPGHELTGEEAELSETGALGWIYGGETWDEAGMYGLEGLGEADDGGGVGSLLGSSDDVVTLSMSGYEIDNEYYWGTQVVTGTWEAALSASEVLSLWGGGTCEGFIGASPTHQLYVYSGTSSLRLYADAPADAVVLIEGPLDSGAAPQVQCATPGDGGLLYDFTVAGNYRIWVGGQSGSGGEYRLRYDLDESP